MEIWRRCEDDSEGSKKGRNWGIKKEEYNRKKEMIEWKDSSWYEEIEWWRKDKESSCLKI